MCRALQRANRPLKKTFRAHERDEGTRVLFQDMASTLEAKRLVVIDESGVSVGMPPAYSRAPVGNRAYSKVPFNRGRHYTLLASLRLSGLSTPLVIEGAADRAVFEAYLCDCLGPTLVPNDIVVMDNVRFHKTAAVEALIHQRGAVILWLPPYSPDFSPIEHAFSKLKVWLRRAQATTLDALLKASADGILAITLLRWLGSLTVASLDHPT